MTATERAGASPRADVDAAYYDSDSYGYWRQCKYCRAYVQLKLSGVETGERLKHGLICPVKRLELLRLAIAGIRAEMEMESRASRGFMVDQWVAKLQALESE